MRAVVLLLVSIACSCTRDDVERKRRLVAREEVRRNLLEREQKQLEVSREAERVLNHLSRTTAALPTHAELPSLLEDLQGAAGETGARLVSWKLDAERPHGDLVELGIDMELAGAFARLADWLDRVQNLARVVVVTDLSIGNPRVEAGEAMLDARVRLAIYRRGDSSAPPSAPPPPVDKNFESDPEIAALRDRTRDLERLEAMLARAEADAKKLEDLLRRRGRAARLVHEIREILAGNHPSLTDDMRDRLSRDPNRRWDPEWKASNAWVERLSFGGDSFRLEGGAAKSTDVVEFAKRLQASRHIVDPMLSSEEAATRSGIKAAYRKFVMTGKVE